MLWHTAPVRGPAGWGRRGATALLLVLAGSVGSGGVGAQERPTLLSNDPRLAAKVVAQAEGVPVGDLLAQIAAKSNVPLMADSETTDDKIIAFGPSRPLYAVLNDIAALFGDVWTAGKLPDGSIGYRLSRARATRRLEAGLLGQSKARMMDALNKQADALNETPEQLKQRPVTDPVRSILSGADGRAATQFYALLTPAQQQSLFDEGQTDSFPFASLTPPQQQPLRAWFARRTAALQEYADKVNSANMMVVVPTPQDLERGTVRFTLSGSAGRDTSLDLQIGKASLPLRKFPARLRTLLPAHGDPYTGRPVASSSVLPDAARTGAASAPEDWRDRLHQLSEQAQIPIMADYYRSATPLTGSDPVVPLPNAPDVAALDALCQPDAYLWWIQGKTLLLRKREWYIARQFEAPDRWTLEMARSITAHKGEPTYADLLRLTQLTINQIAGLATAHGVPELQQDSLLDVLAIMDACLLNTRQTLPTQPTVVPGTQTVADPSESAALLYNGPNVVPGLLRRCLAHLPTASPADMSGVKIKAFYNYLLLTDPKSPTRKALAAAQKRQEALLKTEASEEDESKRLAEEVMRLQVQESSEAAARNTADGRFVYVNITAILLRKQDNPTAPPATANYEIPGLHGYTLGPMVSLSDLSEFPSTFHYHVILPRVLPGDRSSRTRIQILP